MGNIATITHKKFPKQGEWLGKPVVVTFHMNRKNMFRGTIVRDDVQEPFKTIISLLDGRYVLSSECQYTLAEES